MHQKICIINYSILAICMRLLKGKILRVQSINSKECKKGEATSKETKVEDESIIENITQTMEKVKKVKGSYKKKKREPQNLCQMHDIKATKNIVKNYGRAICNFILSPVSRPYLNDIIHRDHKTIEIESFISYIQARKETIDCIERIKQMLIVTENDDEEEAAFKTIFKKIGEIFIKYFSVNWIFGGRLTYKQAHVAFRFKMLRRLRNPELFTHLKSFVKR